MSTLALSAGDIKQNRVLVRGMRCVPESRRRAAMVHELDRSFVPAIEKAAGPRVISAHLVAHYRGPTIAESIKSAAECSSTFTLVPLDAIRLSIAADGDRPSI